MGLKIDREELADLLKKLKLIAFIFLVELQCLNILFPISLIFFSVGVIGVNIVLSAVSALLLIFTIVRYFQENQLIKTVKRIVDRVCRIIKIIAKAISLGISIYGIVIIINDVNWFSVLVVVLSVILWTIQVIIEVIREIVESQMEKITKAVKDEANRVKDKAKGLLEKGKNTVSSVKNTLTGQKSNKPTDNNE